MARERTLTNICVFRKPCILQTSQGSLLSMPFTDGAQSDEAKAKNILFVAEYLRVQKRHFRYWLFSHSCLLRRLGVFEMPSTVRLQSSHRDSTTSLMACQSKKFPFLRENCFFLSSLCCTFWPKTLQNPNPANTISSGTIILPCALILSCRDPCPQAPR